MSGAQRLATRLLLALSIAVGGFAVAAGAASAAPLTLYAAPAGSGNCADPADACTLASALGMAGGEAGDAVTIQLAAGVYGSATISAGSETSLALAGTGGAVISTATGGALTVNASGLTVTLEQLAIEGGSADVQLTAATHLTIVDSALIAGAGDGLDASGGALLIRDSTIAGNAGRGIYDTHATAAALYGSTIAHNNQAGVIEAGASSPVDLSADLLFANGSNDCSGAGTITDQGYDDSEDSTCPVGATSHDNDAQLSVAAPAANGGSTETARLDSTGDPNASVPTAFTIPGDSVAFCAGSDERGIARTQGPASSCDAGSYEYAPPVVTAISPRSALEPGLTATLSGYGFANGTTASFGSTAAPITSESDSSLTLNVPTSLGLGSQPITLTNADGSTQVPFDALAPPQIGTWLMTPGELKVAYSQPLPTSGGAAPFSFTLLGGALPAGLALSSSGLVSGTPTKAGGTAFAVQVTDANGITSPPLNVSLIIATPVLKIAHARLPPSAGMIPVALSCRAAPCSGTVTLDEPVTVKLHRKSVTRAVALASTRYSLAAGQAATVLLVLTPAGQRAFRPAALRKARKHPLEETLNATVAGGTTATSLITLR